MPLVTVITPTHNRRALLEETIASVRAQTFTDWEYIIVDDASSDDTWERIQALGGTDPRIRPIPLEVPAERAGARNTGLAQARGAFVLFLDDDDHLQPFALAAHLKALQAFPAIIASVAGYTLFDSDGHTRPMPITRRPRAADTWPAIMLGWVPVSGQWLFRTETIRELGGWDGAHIPIEDHVLLLQFTRLGPVALLPQLALRYRVHPGQWRPANLDEMMTRVREAAINALPPAEQPAAQALLLARGHYRLADQHYWRAEARPAFLNYFRAVRAAPALLRNPITRGLILPRMLKSLTGRLGMQVGGRLMNRLRKWSGRSVRSTVTITDPRP